MSVHGLETVSSLFTSTNSDTIVSLWSARRQLTTSKLIALFEVLQWRYPNIADSCAPAYKALRAVPVKLLSEIFGSPSGLLWLETLQECLEASPGEAASEHIGRAECLAEHGEALCRVVANRLWVFALAASHRACLDDVSHPTTRVRGPSIIPTAGFAVRADEFAVERLSSGVQGIKEAIVERLATVKIGSISVEIASHDRILASDCFETAPKLSDMSGIATFTASLGEALRLLLLVDPEMEAEIAASLRCVVPIIATTAGVFRSGTPSRTPGLAYLTVTTSPCHLIDMLIHEAAHSQLFVVQEIEDPLLCPETHGDGWTAPLVYSPWRDDPRPLNGLLHACYVFWRVARFWLDACAAEAVREEVRLFALRRLSALAPQLEAGLTELIRAAQWTPVGHRFASSLADRIGSLASAARLAGADTVQPEHVLGAAATHDGATGAEQQRLHGERWQARYRS
jgi:HEXXH motif-containing protein